jgi:hypothetical protein
MKIPVLAFLVAALFSGCATNNFSKFYVDKTVGASPSLLNKRLQPYSGVTQVYSSNNLQRDAVELARRNYFILGESAFEAGGQNTNLSVPMRFFTQPNTKDRSKPTFRSSSITLGKALRPIHLGRRTLVSMVATVFPLMAPATRQDIQQLQVLGHFPRRRFRLRYSAMRMMRFIGEWGDRGYLAPMWRIFPMKPG